MFCNNTSFRTLVYQKMPARHQPSSLAYYYSASFIIRTKTVYIEPLTFMINAFVTIHLAMFQGFHLSCHSVKVSVHTSNVLWHYNPVKTQNRVSLTTSCIVTLFTTIELWSLEVHFDFKDWGEGSPHGSLHIYLFCQVTWFSTFSELLLGLDPRALYFLRVAHIKESTMQSHLKVKTYSKLCLIRKMSTFLVHHIISKVAW